MGNLLLNENGTPLVVPSGTFTRFNQTEYPTVPGTPFYLKGKKAFRDPNFFSPYVITDLEVIERNEIFLFCKVEGYYFHFVVKIDDEGREYFTTSRKLVPGISDDEKRAFADFIEAVHTFKQKRKAQAAAAAEANEAAVIKAQGEKKRITIKTAMLDNQKQIQSLTPDLTADQIMKNKKIQELLDNYNRLETLMKIRAL